MRVLGIDPGFANIGWAIVEFSDSGKPSLLDFGNFETEKDQEATSASRDNIRRAAEFAAFLGEGTRTGEYAAFCCEAMSYPRNAVAAAKMSMAWGVIIATATANNIPILQATPMDVKKRVVGIKTASKSQVQKAINSRFPNAKQLMKSSGLPKGKWEHPYDAAASALACQVEAKALLLKNVIKTEEA